MPSMPSLPGLPGPAPGGNGSRVPPLSGLIPRKGVGEWGMGRTGGDGGAEGVLGENEV